MVHSNPSFAPAHLVNSLEQSLAAAADAAALMLTAGDTAYEGRHINIGGSELLNFGGCSYLGLEQRQELRDAAIAAIHQFGTQFSFSRAFVELPLYPALETSLQQMTGGHVLVTPTTSLAHIAALPVLLEPEDAVLIDVSAHASLHTAVALLHKNRVEHVRHNRIDILERRIERLAKEYRRIWYVFDGVYSMLGDFAPMDELATLVQKHPSLHLYVDDAHSTSWTGTHGRGYALECLPACSRMVVALSLNKAFSAAGGALVFPNAEDAASVRRGGGPMVFSGPIQPPMLGAAVASAKIHLSPELAVLQKELDSRFRLVISLANELGVPLADETLSPIFFVRCGKPEITFEMSRALRKRNFCVCAVSYPIVPREQSGIRFTISSHNTPDDIERLLHTLSEESDRLGISLHRSQSVLKVSDP